MPRQDATEYGGRLTVNGREVNDRGEPVPLSAADEARELRRAGFREKHGWKPTARRDRYSD